MRVVGVVALLLCGMRLNRTDSGEHQFFATYFAETAEECVEPQTCTKPLPLRPKVKGRMGHYVFDT